MNLKLRAMIEGAITAALFIIILLVLLYTPLGMLTFVLLPIPFIVYTARHNWSSSLLVGFLSFLVTIPFGLIWAFPLLFYAWLVGLGLGYSFAKKHSAIQTVMVGFLSTLIFFLLAILVAALVFNVNLIEQVATLSKEIFTESEQLFGSSFKESMPANMGEILAEEVRTRFTAYILIYSFILGFINYWIGYGLLKRLRFSLTPFPPFSELRFPRSLLFYYLILMVLFMIPSLYAISWIRVIVLNVMPVLEMILAFQGVLFLFFIAKQKKTGKWLPVLGFVLLFIPIFQYILRLIGIFDLGLNLRQKFSSRS